ncbi:MAG: NADH-quinone oxidoreductase subunit J [Microthrixaceae bacterium]
MRVEMLTFLLAGAICLGGALGVVLLRNPVHNALSLVATLFGIAVLFLNQGAYFLAAIQVIVYAGAIVVLFLFVIMLLGVDRAEALERDPLVGQRVTAIIIGVAILGLSLTVLLAAGERATGAGSGVAPLDPGVSDVNRLGRVLFTDYVFAFEITALLLTVAVIGAVVLSRKVGGSPIDLDEFPDGTALDQLPAPPEDGSDDGDVVPQEAGSDRGPIATLRDEADDPGHEVPLPPDEEGATSGAGAVGSEGGRS